MENTGNQKKWGILLATGQVVLFILLIVSIAFMAKQFMGLNASVENERSVFISQIAEQMKNMS